MKTLVSFLFLLTLLVSCRDKKSNKVISLNKNERLELFLESPIKVNTSINEQKLNNIKFHKSYILRDNLHLDKDRDSIIKAYSNSYVSIGESNLNENRDSIIRISSNNDVIEILKNKYVEHIIYMRINSKGMKLNYGIRIGMSLDSFTKLLPLHIDKNYSASYIDEESFEVKFLFDKESKKLKEIKYLFIID